MGLETYRGDTMAEEADTTSASAWDDDTPGDPVCWLNRVCPGCGALADTDPPTTCPRCQAPMPGD